MGEHKQRLREKGKADLVFDVNVMTILPKDRTGTRFALVQLEGAWETLEEDRIPLPEPVTS